MTSPRLIRTTCLASLVLPAAAYGQPLGADDYILNVLVRDMKPGHEDFTHVSPDAYTRIVGLAMPTADTRPELSAGGGFELDVPARDSKGNLVPHHLATLPSGPGAGKTSIASTAPTVLKDGAGNDAFAVTLLSVTYNPDETSSWVYRVEELPGAHGLRRWSLDLDLDHIVMSGTTPGYSRGADSIGWSVPESFTSGEFTIVLDRWYEADVWPDNVDAQSAMGVVHVVNPPVFKNKAYADTYDSAAGPYDPATAGPAPEFITGSTMPVLEEPEMSVAWQPSYILTKKKTTVLDHDIHTDVFRLRNGHTLQIDGHVTLLVEDSFELNNSSTIDLLPGATLDIYFKGAAEVLQASGINEASKNPHRVRIFNLGSDEFLIRNHNMVFASLVSPNAPLVMDNNTDFFGSVTAQGVEMHNSTALHIDGLPTSSGAILAPTAEVAEPGAAPGCLELADTLAVTGLPHDGDISMYFATWFLSVPGWNQAAARGMIMRWNEDTQSWRYRSDDFRPIDGDLYSASLPHERNGTFTLAVNAAFDYETCSGRFFELAADGDAWVYINGKLAMDMGGMLRGDRQLLELDRLEDLASGPDNRLQIFFAHRDEDAAQFEIHTNLQLRTFSSGFSVAPLAD